MLVPLLNVPGEPHDIDYYFVVFHAHASADDKTRVRHLARRGRLRMGDEGLGVGEGPIKPAKGAHVHSVLNEHVYSHALNGFSMRLEKQGVYELMAHTNIISYIERDMAVKALKMPLKAHHGRAILQASETPTQTPSLNPHVYVSSARGNASTDTVPVSGFGSSSTGYTEMISGTTEFPAAGWNLDRLDQRNWNVDPGAFDGYGDNSYTYRATGYGVDVYVMDTGINYINVDFEGRATPFYDGKNDAGFGVDCDGHGSHVAGIIGGKKWGVAKGVNLKGVKVLNCFGQGYASDVVMGIDYVVANRASAPSVMNLSLGGSFSQAMNDAVSRAVAANITVVTAAGNDYGSDACLVSPASSPQSFTVGATDSLDNMADYSNAGSCIHIFAPGTNVVSNFIGHDSVPANTSITSMDGTSMAAPHVAGVAALYLEANPASLPAKVRTALTSLATANILQWMDPVSPNLLLFAKVVNDSWVAPPTPTYQATKTPTRSPTRTQTRTRTPTRSATPPRTQTNKAGTPTQSRRTGTVSPTLRTPTRSFSKTATRSLTRGRPSPTARTPTLRTRSRTPSRSSTTTTP